MISSFQLPFPFLVLMQVVETLQSGNKSKRDTWRTELPSIGLERGVIFLLENEKENDPVWQGRCSGTVYVFHLE